jgi:hypothetical protein
MVLSDNDLYINDLHIKADENDEKIALRRIIAGRGILRNHGRNNNSPETGLFALRDE